MAEPRRFSGKSVIVTGAAQGIGKACAKLFAADGARVMLADIQEDAIRKAAAEIGGEARCFIGDLASYDANRALIEETLTAFGRIDAAVFNVGGTILAKPLSDYQEDEIKAEIDRSLWPTLWGCRAVLPVMLDQKSGVIVTVGSVATRGVNRVPYAAAKGGVAAITTALAQEIGDQGVRINCVAAGATQVTDRTEPRRVETLGEDARQHVEAVIQQTLKDTPMGRFGTVEEQAEAIAFLASDAAAYITGQILNVAGGGIG